MRLFLVVALATIATATLPPMFGGRRRGGFTSHLHANVTGNSAHLDDATMGSAFLDQKLDHFDTENTKTWQQRYFYNMETGNVNSKVNFLYLSGEQTAVVGMVQCGSYVEYARALNAPIYALEHRFYGVSHPTEDTSIENLKYLSSRQAIEDIAVFIKQKNAEKGGDQKWIVVGGSYAGNLAAWSRLKHPELIAGSLASSAPVLAQLDFYGYLQTVDDVFNKTDVLCYDQISKGLEEAERLMQSPDGRDQLSNTFKISPPLSDFDVVGQNDIELFYSYLISPFMDSAQYNSPFPANLCEKFTVDGEDADPLNAFQRLMKPTMNVNYTGVIQYLTNTDYLWDNDRIWLYQTCTELGFFQTTDRGTNVFGQIASTRLYIEYCIYLFNIDADQIQKNIESTNAYYGERDYFAGTNVIFSHGTQDPWSFLAKRSDPKHWSVVIAEIEDGDHCSDLGAYCLDNKNCNDNMRQVQQLTLENMQRWIDPLYPVPDRVEITDNVGKRPNFYDTDVKPAQPQIVNAPDATRAERSMITSLNSHRLHSSKWNKFTGKGRRVLPPGGNGMQYDGVNVGQDWIVQTWDHFNTNEDRTFKQKWYFNYKFGSADGPNFLMIGGEGPESDYWVTHENLAWMTYAKAVGANVFDLEHRYYGESKLGTKDLQYLTSAQMLYDVAAFIRTQQTKFGRTGPWITFGGSYPGALAAWSREWFPELILGAVGSSGPVLAKNDFYEYLEVVEDVLKRQSEKCYDRIAEAIEKFRELTLSPDGRKTLQKKFNIWPKWRGDATIEPLDMDTVFSGLNGIFMGTVQYNAVNWADVKAVCAPFESDEYEDSLDALRAAQEHAYGEKVETLSNFNYEISYYKIMLKFIDGKHHIIKDDDLAGVLWMWQTCNEFGYYQSTDYGEGIFGTNVPLNFYVTMCEKIFGVNMDTIEAGVARTNYQYGGRLRFNTTNVVLPNGDADPWHALGLLDRGNLDDSIVPVVIKGTSHCADMYGATAADPPELTQARKTILENIKKWLAPAQTTTEEPIQTTEVITTVHTTEEPIQTTEALIPEHTTEDPIPTTKAPAPPTHHTTKTKAPHTTTTVPPALASTSPATIPTSPPATTHTSTIIPPTTSDVPGTPIITAVCIFVLSFVM